MITCPHCGKQLEDNVAFCIYCQGRIGKYGAAGAAGAGAAGAASEAGEELGQGFAAGTDTVDPNVEQAESVSGVEHGSGLEPAPAPEPVAYSEEDYANEAVAPAEDYYDDTTAAGAGMGVGETAEMPAAEYPAEDLSAQEQRLHPEDSFEQRMGIPDERRSGGKVIAGALIALLAAAGIGVGGMMIAGNGLFGGDTQSTSSSDASGSGSEDGSSDSSSASSSSSSSDASESSSSVETKRGATPSRANSSDEGSGNGSEGAGGSGDAGSGENAGDSGSGGDSGNAGGGDSGNAGSGDSGNAGGGDSGSGGGTGGGSGGGSLPAFSPYGATATSISPTEGSTPHGPDLVLDGNTATAWNTNESGIGQSITINAGEMGSLSGIRVMGGYNKTSYRGEDLYYANARPQEVLVEYEGGSTWFTMSDSKGTYQDIWFDGTYNTSWVRLTILSVYPGNAYDDCCISEIQLL